MTTIRSENQTGGITAETVDWADVTSKPAIFEMAWGTAIRDPRMLVVIGGQPAGRVALLEPQSQSRTGAVARWGFGGHMRPFTDRELLALAALD